MTELEFNSKVLCWKLSLIDILALCFCAHTVHHSDMYQVS